eukprot:CAMPEP_0177296976 /NCGR_PEP_ID=MMETSP0368-20130122/2713_1 /TAXON_ID=447022 ORGANISM="Scrippsiella hangoei-like, Strain SHHI-4" /NCGR_SAMPLE_ID=MMETSP0368 /ASSEMBLY_ACC=CAM_ASM_000363 /LENGTH=492 /DNA_ID=CAMNT_0018755145 /DNA_START=72 /DNA_END=1551 /DNA_ORIENTATION=-
MSMGTYNVLVYTEEQQARLGVDEQGNSVQAAPAVAAEAPAAAMPAQYEVEELQARLCVDEQGSLVHAAPAAAAEAPAAAMPAQYEVEAPDTEDIIALNVAGEVQQLNLPQVLEMLSASFENRARICILGGTAFHDPVSEALTAELSRRLSAQFGEEVIFVTGGMKGVQEVFANNCLTPGLYHLVPIGQASGFPGQDVEVGADLDQRKKVFGKFGDIYITIEGGPGVAQEARDAFERGAAVVPMIRTGGASEGKMNFPAGALEAPPFVAPEHWELLKSKEASVEESANAAVEIVGAILSQMPVPQPLDAGEEVEIIVRTMAGSRGRGGADDSAMLPDLVATAAEALGLPLGQTRLALMDGSLLDTNCGLSIGQLGIPSGTEVSAIVVNMLVVRRHIYNARGGAPPYRGSYLTASDEVELDVGVPLCQQFEKLLPPQTGPFPPSLAAIDASPEGAPQKWEEHGLSVDPELCPEEAFGDQGAVELVVLMPMQGMD